jgi:hypothetical protein
MPEHAPKWSIRLIIVALWLCSFAFRWFRSEASTWKQDMFQVIWFGSMPKCLDHFGSHPLVLLPRVQLPSPWVPNTLQSHVNWAHHSSPILFGMTTYMYRTCIVCIHIHTVVLISYPIQKHNTYFILFLNSPLFYSTSSCKQSQSIETLRMAVSSPYHHVLQLTSGSWGQVGAWTTWKPRPRRRPKRAGEAAKISGFRPDAKIGAGNDWKPLEELNIEDMEDDSLSFHIRGIDRSWFFFRVDHFWWEVVCPLIICLMGNEWTLCIYCFIIAFCGFPH